MALFGSKKKTDEVQLQPAQSARLVPQSSSSGVAHVLKRPRITEKASMHQGLSVYTFDVAESATKSQIAAAVRNIYKVNPRKVRIIKVPSKMTRSLRTGRTGVKTGGKKAYVYLMNGESISIA